MPGRDGGAGMLPSTLRGAVVLALALLAAAIATATLADLLGWGSLLLSAVAFLIGVWTGASGASLRAPPGADTARTAARAASGAAVAPAGAGASSVATAADGGATTAGGTTPVESPRGMRGVDRPDQGWQERPGAEAAGTRSDPGRPLPARDTDAVVEALAHQLGVARLVVWQQDPSGALEPWLSSGDPPPRLSPKGQPLLWSLEHDQPLRLEEPPIWAAGPVLAVPVRLDRERVLITAEAAGMAGAAGGPHAALPDEAAVRQAGTVIDVVVGLVRREGTAARVHGRLERILDFLRDVSRDAEGGAFPDELAMAAAEVGGAVGAAVASWEGETGQVLARVGDAGGPARGTWFGVMEGDFAMAARAGTTLHRDRRGGRALPLAEPGERWASRPRYTGIVPLRTAAGDPTGLVAVWGDDPLVREGLELLEALGPLLSLQLHHSTNLAAFRQRATEDALTGLANRGFLEERIERERKRFHRYRRPVALLVLDLDHFKRVNDTHGHPAGDAILVRVAEILQEATRATDLAARYGGEELVVLMEETMRHQAAEVAERIRAAIAGSPLAWNHTTIPVTASIGVSACPECVEDPADLMRSADSALYASKGAGRNRVTVAAVRDSEG